MHFLAEGEEALLCFHVCYENNQFWHQKHFSGQTVGAYFFYEKDSLIGRISQRSSPPASRGRFRQQLKDSLDSVRAKTDDNCKTIYR